MLTIFTTPKAFRGHIDVIQRNALESWRRLDANVEVILFGDEDGAAEVCVQMGLRHEPTVERTATGTKFVRSIFGRAQEIAKHSVVAYVNCDIVLTDDFARGVALVGKQFSANGRFLMVGRRWDTEITASLDFSASDWAERARVLARKQNRQQSQDWIDYFVFPRGMYREIPGLVIGRVGWDNWLVWKARAEGASVLVVGAEASANRWDPEGASKVLHVWVKDNGIGISPEDQGKIFQKFFRSEDQKAREVPGTGLGLNITKSLVEMQGGRIWFESEFRKGTTFHFTIPVAEG